MTASIIQKATLTIVDERKENPPGAEGVCGLAAGVLRGAASVGEQRGNQKVFTVPFNPASLSIYSHSSPIRVQAPGPVDKQEASTQVTKNASTTLSVQLQFDAVNLHDAFMADKIQLTAQSAGMHIAELATEKTFSVRPQINGLLAVTMDPGLKRVTFAWGGFRFTGTLSDVSAKYTMFSVSGEPVRGQVDLTLEESHESLDQQRTEEAFDALFQGTGLTGSAVGISQLAGNLLGL